ncbi:MAG: ABC transporter substrate-binding protein [Vulcanimicrobiaceae bacterium]
MAVAAAAMALAACSGARAPRVPATAHRIVSLVPSLTADLCAIGAGRQIVGVSAYSASIPCAKNVPRVGDAVGIDAERIVALKPDVVVGIAAQARLTQALREGGVPTRFFKDDTYLDIFRDIEELGALSGHRESARRLIARLRGRTRRIRASEHFRRRPRVFVVLQSEPIWTAGPGSYVSTRIRLAGGDNAVTALPAPWGQYSAEALLELQPDAIVTVKAADLPAVLHREPWRSLRAVRRHRVFVVERPSILEQPGPEYNMGIAWLVAHLRPLAR